MALRRGAKGPPAESGAGASSHPIPRNSASRMRCTKSKSSGKILRYSAKPLTRSLMSTDCGISGPDWTHAGENSREEAVAGGPSVEA
ncbi:hypothetical protein ILYODFUR_028269 [Ilyodon furcidens]|uniref:Uncharacterized protein n=1 Tax=Ilyodon furcidens TaxID=33524 RepID=A0ABV0VHY2_9TELE